MASFYASDASLAITLAAPSIGTNSRRRAPQTSCIGIEGSFFQSISGLDTRAVEQVPAANIPAVQCRGDLFIRASGEAIESARKQRREHLIEKHPEIPDDEPTEAAGCLAAVISLLYDTP